MKILLAAINSRYIHMSLAVWRLSAMAKKEGIDVEILEYTISDKPEKIIGDIYRKKPDIAGFSTYIWNIDMTLSIVRELKKVLPCLKIILGGPEVSFENRDILENYYVDFCIKGEGEYIFPDLLKCLMERKNPRLIKGISYIRDREYINTGGYETAGEIDRLENPYTDEMLTRCTDRILYLETSRGCPFSCSYCMSPAVGGVRFLSLDKTFEMIDKLDGSNARQIKFVDRTFNCNKNRANIILNHIASKNSRKNWHFEVAADLCDKEMLDIIKSSRPGLFQFEAGIQSTNTKTLIEVARKTDIKKALYIIGEIGRTGKSHIHGDLIAGLPYEDMESFKKSFDDLYKTNLDMLQLGFLKLLKGSRIRSEAGLYGMVYQDMPTYEIYKNKWISYEELLLLKEVEEVLEFFYNSGAYKRSLDYIISNFFDSPFKFFYDFLEFIKISIDNGKYSKQKGYELLYNFTSPFLAKEETAYFKDLLKFDYLKSDKNSQRAPVFYTDDLKYKEEIRRIWDKYDNNKRIKVSFFICEKGKDDTVAYVFYKDETDPVTGLLKAERVV